MEYMIEFDGNNDCYTVFWDYDDFGDLMADVEAELKVIGGGHADIYDEDDNFIEEVEV